MGWFLQLSIVMFKYMIMPVSILYFILKTFLLQKQKVQNELIPKKKIAFFHPYCNAAGGGEKVLWCLVYSLFTHMKYINQFEIAIYTGDTETDEKILEKASNRFNINLVPYAKRVTFVRVSGRKMLEPQGFATMILQILGTMLYTLKALWIYQPDIFFDSTGLAFSYPLAKKLLRNCMVISYTHYPFISSDMLAKVKSNQASFNNNTVIASSTVFSKLKVVYYYILTLFYKSMGNYSDMTFTNSTWTNQHMRALWKPCRKEKTITESILLYPPCNVSSLLELEKDSPNKRQRIQIMSFAQFRPEKDHPMQIRIFERAAARLSEQENAHLSFKIVGSVRNADDEALLKALQREVTEKKLEDSIQFIKNPSFQELIKHFEESTIGIHTMKDEHFGIAVVEMMAAGMITIAHKSAGPLKDIIQTSEFGFLCENEDEYVEALIKAIQMSPQERISMREKSREKAKQFSDEEFMVLSAAHFEHFLEYYNIVEEK